MVLVMRLGMDIERPCIYMIRLVIDTVSGRPKLVKNLQTIEN